MTDSSSGARHWLRYARLLGPDVRADVEEEIAFHLDMRTRELMAAGRSPEAARAEAERMFGAAAPIREQCVTIDHRRQQRTRRRDLRGDLMQDLKLAIRGLRKGPAFAVMAIGCIALGVCVTTTIFTAVNAILIRPLPYSHAERLVAVYARLADKDEHGVNISYPDYISWRDENRTFSGLGMYTWSSHTLSEDGDAERIEGAYVTANLFPTLGVSPLLGRGFEPSEEQPGQDREILLSYGLWQRRYGGARELLGRTITMDGLPYTVIGIMPPHFNFPDRGQAWVPLVQEEWMRGRGNRGIAGAIGRTKPGVTLAAVQADLDVISRRLQQAYPDDNFGWDAEAYSLRDDLVGDLRRPLLVLQGAVLFVLLIACANVANLMLARGTTRQRDLAIRVALGAGRRRIAWQMLTESLVIAVLGGAAGAALTVPGVRVLRLAFPDDVPFYISLGVNRTALLFAAAVAVLTGVLFGIVPALRAMRTDPNTWLKQDARGDVGGGASHRLRNGLVVAEVALSLVLLVGATLLIRSYRSLTGTDLGFTVRGVLAARVSLPPATYADADRRRTFFQTLYQRLAALPGVDAVGSANGIPFSGWNVQAQFSIEGRPAPARGDELVVHHQNISPDYFAAIGVPITRGRGFTTADRDPGVHIGVINEVLAQREFAGQDPVGKRIKFGAVNSTEPWITIIGVAGTFRHYRLPRPMGPAIYFPQLATPWATQTLVLRTALDDPTALAPALRRALHEQDPNVPAFQVQSFEQMVSRSLWRQRFQGQVLGIFAGLALLLALVGIYGVISYTVAQRTRELGVRMALGAGRRHVLGSVVRQGLRLATAGVAIGVAGALVLSGVVSRLLYGVGAKDPMTFTAVPLGLLLVAVLASWVPAMRATRVDPVVAMRAE